MKTKKWLKVLWILLVVIAVGIAGFFIYAIYFKPNLPLKEVKVESTPERIERGRYLANHVTVCIDCHSTRDWSKFSGLIVPGTEGKGGEVFDQKLGFPGKFIAPNITPYNLKDWTDAEIYRAIVGGVDRKGKPLFPIMPYPYYGTLDTEDIYSIIAYIRSLPSIPNNTEASKADFPMSVIMHFIPHYGVPTTRPEKAVTAEYGKYLVTAASCIECHTQVKNGQIIPDLAFGGGRQFQLPGGLLISPNITPDNATGIGKWTPEAFLTRFKTATVENYSATTLDKNTFNTMMPWTMYSGMDTTDLLAVYAYLRTVKPISNTVTQRYIPNN